MFQAVEGQVEWGDDSKESSVDEMGKSAKHLETRDQWCADWVELYSHFRVLSFYYGLVTGSH
jgi:hypothetical protein